MFLLDDVAYLKKIFFRKLGYELNLDCPRTFNEKIQWLKLYNRKNEYTMMSDKLAVKDYVGSLIGFDYIIPTIAVYDSVDEIDFEKLPQKFVLKCTHDSGSTIICRDKSKIDVDEIRERLEYNLSKNYFWGGREWPYKNISPKIIEEKFLCDVQDGELRDYKFFVFGGKVKTQFIATERNNPDIETKFDFLIEIFSI